MGTEFTVVVLGSTVCCTTVRVGVSVDVGARGIGGRIPVWLSVMR